MLGEWMAQQRQRSNTSGCKLAEQMGITRQSVSLWELDNRLPSVTKYRQWAECLALSAEQTEAGLALLHLAYEQRRMR